MSNQESTERDLLITKAKQIMTTKSLHAVLGVSRESSESEIKKAYRKVSPILNKLLRKIKCLFINY